MEDKIIFFTCSYLLFAIFLSIYIFDGQVLAAFMAVAIVLFYVFCQSAFLNKLFKITKANVMNNILKLRKQH